jgi:NAD+ diphosphatase
VGPSRGRHGSGAPYLALVLSESAGEERDFGGVATGPDEPLVAGRQWASLRDVGAVLGARDAGLAVAAVALAAWHARHPRCPRCGEPSRPVLSGWARRCPADGTLHHPRTDPAVIVAVTDPDDRLLLAHAAHWPARRFSLVAGYVEPGESLEAAARREVAEECDVAVTDLAYQGSQPWPFPASLMLGFRARTSDTTPTPDGVEVTEAAFVAREQLAGLVSDGGVLLPMRASIARVLIEEWFGEPLPGA